MPFETAGDLYSQTLPFVRNELERLKSLGFLKAEALPEIFGNTGTEGGENTINIEVQSKRMSMRIRDIFFAHPNITTDILASNTAFWVQHLLKNPERKLRYFDPHAEENKIIPVKPNTHIPLPGITVNALYQAADFAEQFALLEPIFSHAKLDVLLWKKFVENLEALGDQIRAFKQRIEQGEKNLFVVTNHLTWANIPFLAFCFHHFLDIPKERLYAMIGPAILTSEFEFEGARRWMNLILTWPDTPKGDTGYPQADKVQKAALKNALKIMRDASEGVRVVFLAPSGTSDTIKDGKCLMSSPSKGTLSLMETIGSRYEIFPIGVNDADIMAPNGLPKKGEIHLKIGEPIRSSVADSIVLTELPKLVVNSKGDSVGEWYYPKRTTNPILEGALTTESMK